MSGLVKKYNVETLGLSEFYKVHKMTNSPGIFIIFKRSKQIIYIFFIDIFPDMKTFANNDTTNCIYIYKLIKQ